MKKVTSHLSPVAVAMLLLGSGLACASSVTLDGTDVNFTFDDSLLGQFGAPTVSGNALFFTPPDFKATSTNGMGTVLNSSNFNVLVTPNQGVTLSSLGLTERGDYSLNGGNSSVDVGGQIRAFGVANPFTAEDVAPISSADLTLNDNKFHNWVATAIIDLSSAKWQDAGAINFTLENVLDATTNNSNASKAYISKDFSGLWVAAGSGDSSGDQGESGGDPSVPPSAVPVPAAAWLFGSGLVGLVGMSRRKYLRT